MRRGISLARDGPRAAPSFSCSWARDLTVCFTLGGETTPTIGLALGAEAELGGKTVVSEARWTKEPSLIALKPAARCDPEVTGEEVGPSLPPLEGAMEGEGDEPLDWANLALAHLMPS